MNNEEKILALLETMQSDIADLKAGQAKLETGLAQLEAGQKRIRKDISAMQVELKSGVWDEINRLYQRMDRVEKRMGIQ